MGAFTIDKVTKTKEQHLAGRGTEDGREVAIRRR